jgi:carbamoyl-phosphate synthase large subunit
MNILVTGLSGDIGNAVGRILSESNICSTLLGCDVHEEHGGRQVFDDCFVVPKAEDPNYIPSLRKLVDQNTIGVIIPSSEPEQRFLLSQNMLQKIGSAKLLLANRQSMEIGFDKLATTRFLEKENLPHPWTFEVSKRKPKSLPCILKSRAGQGSKDVIVVSRESDVNAYQNLRPKAIWQELVGNDSSEYTCGVYRSVTGEIRVISFRRRLANGHTMYGELVDNENIKNLCQVVATRLNLVGSINLQLRLVDDVPIVFEINPRFSSTVMVRHLMGFQDVIWSIQELLFGSLPKYESKYEEGTVFYRDTVEVII